jgi:hypothetical protein
LLPQRLQNCAVSKPGDVDRGGPGGPPLGHPGGISLLCCRGHGVPGAGLHGAGVLGVAAVAVCPELDEELPPEAAAPPPGQELLQRSCRHWRIWPSVLIMRACPRHMLSAPASRGRLR